MASTAINRIKKALKPKKKKKQPAGYLSTGSTLLNCGCTGRPFRGLRKGRYYFFVGDSSSGKSFLCMNILAEAAKNPEFDGYRFIQDNPEDGTLMDISKFFGKKVAERLEPPARDEDGNEVHSFTVEDLYYNIDDAVKKGTPFIYIIDSMDALTSIDEEKRFATNKNIYRKMKKRLDAIGNKDDEQKQGKLKESYGDGKAKKNSTSLRRIPHFLKQSGSILIIINQTRDNIGFSAMFNPKTRAGGHALKFYATLEFWSSVQEKIKVKDNKRKKIRKVGNLCRFQIKKNRQTGQDCSVKIPIYDSYGIDDLGSCVDYLLEEKHWNKSKGVINAKEFGTSLTKEKLIAKIEEDGEESKLQKLVGQVWQEIQEEFRLKRKQRYD